MLDYRRDSLPQSPSIYSRRNFSTAASVLPSESPRVTLQTIKELQMSDLMNRRDLLKLTGMGVAVFVSGTTVRAGGTLQKKSESFYFVQLSDTHWGFNGPNINPDSGGTLRKTVAAVNSLDEQPDFVVFTGDLTQTTNDRKIRRDRMAEFRDIVSQLNVKAVRFMPGEHDASLDRGEAYQEFFGDLHYTFDHNGVHFIVLDNVSDP